MRESFVELIAASNIVHDRFYRLSASVIYLLYQKRRKSSVTIAKTYVSRMHDLRVLQEKCTSNTFAIEVYDGHYVHLKYNKNYKNLIACNLRYVNKSVREEDAINC